MIVALISLCIALGGTGYAATSTRTTSSGPADISAANRGSSKKGPRGKRGKRGKVGPVGPNGLNGATGPTGATGRRGATGNNGATGISGATGATGVSGATGATGVTGPIGPSQFAEFYALMPPDNAVTVAVGNTVPFPHNGPGNGTIVGVANDAFKLPDIGTYRVAFSVPVTEAGQLELTLNSLELPHTVYGRATGTSLISGEALVTTTTTNSLVSVVNPPGNSTALTITPLAGGTHPAVASLVIERLN